MRSELNVRAPNIKITITIGLFVTVLVVILSLLFKFEFGIILLTAAGLFGITSLLLVGRGMVKVIHVGFMTYFDIALRNEELQQARIMTGQLRLKQNVITFGRTERLLLAPGNDWNLIEAHTDGGKIVPAAIAANERKIDLLSVFTDPHFGYGIIGGQRSGKTWQAMHLANYWNRQGVQPWVIGPKAELGEWPDCKLFIRRASTITAALQSIMVEVENRHNSGAGHFPLLPVFLDDWMNIHQLGPALARQFVVNASTIFVSAGVIPYFILHSDTREAWGVDNRGASLKDNLFKLFIESEAGPDGRIVIGQSKGYITYPGKSDPHSVELFRNNPLIGGPPEIVEGQFTQEPDSDEVFRKLVLDEKLSRSEASQRAYGKPYAGTSHVARCKEILED